MTWSPKIILAANFYGSYLRAEEFDDTVIISDAGIDKLMTAVERRVEIYSKLTNKEADIYVFCILGLTDLVEKLMVGSQYILKPIVDAVPTMERKMHDAVNMLKMYRAKIIWSTTYPISLAKYHTSQGWNIDNMMPFGMSMGLEQEQLQLFKMTEYFMDVCHTFNQRSRLPDLFFIRKVYYSRDGQRELLTHNLLEDGINPTSSVTAEWNLELPKYLQGIRRSAASSVSSQNAGLFDGENSVSFGSRETPYNYGVSGKAIKRQPDDSAESYTKRSRLEDSLAVTLGNQPESVQKNLAMGMLKFISDNLGDNALSLKSTERQSLLDRPDFGPGNLNRDSFGLLSNTGFGHRSSSYNNMDSSQLRNSGYSSQHYQGRNVEASSRSASSGFAPASSYTNTSYNSRGNQGFTRMSDSNRKSNFSSQNNWSSTSHNKWVGSSQNRLGGSSLSASTSKRRRKKSKLAKRMLTVGNQKGRVDKYSNLDKNGISAASKAGDKEKSSDGKSYSKKAEKSEGSVLVNDPSMSSKQPQTDDKSLAKIHEVIVIGESVQNPDFSEPGVVKEQSNAKLSSTTDVSSHVVKDEQKTEQADVPGTGGSHNASKETTSDTVSSAKSQTKEVHAIPKHVLSKFRTRILGREMFGSVGNLDELENMRAGLPFLFKSIVTGTEPYFTQDKHKLRSDYIMMAIKRSKQARFYRIMADYDDKPQDELGFITRNNRRFPAFDKSKDLGNRDILPSVAYLKTNQWNPGSEKISAPMTWLQKQVAAFNTNLFQLQRVRVELLDQLAKNKDASICLPTSTCVTPGEKLEELLVKPSAATTSTNDVPDSTPGTNADGSLTQADDMLVSAVKDENQSIDDIPKEVAGDVDAKEDDWTDLEGPNITLLVDITSDAENSDIEKAADCSKMGEKDHEEEVAVLSNKPDKQSPSMDTDVQDTSDCGSMATPKTSGETKQLSPTMESDNKLLDAEPSKENDIPAPPDQPINSSQTHEEVSSTKENDGSLEETLKSESSISLSEPLPTAPDGSDVSPKKSDAKEATVEATLSD